MDRGPEGNRKDIKAHLRDCTDHFLLAMKEDWGRYHTPNSIKMQECIKQIIKERGL
jgi:hypothetical protein